RVAKSLGVAALLCGMIAPAARAALAPSWNYTASDEAIIYHPEYLASLAREVSRCMDTAMQAQARIFGYRPDHKPSIVLRDNLDYSNGSATVMPREAILLYASHPDRSFENNLAANRFCKYANHETTHLANIGQGSPEDRSWRRLFRGKVTPWSPQPESIFYSFLTTPRQNTPRWFLEGAGTFMETWLGGGIGRAQGAYDEMVFRSMVRDGTDFYDPLTLASVGGELDFRGGANAYLYGTRFQSYLALQYSPESLIRWWQREAGTQRDYQKQFEVVYGRSLKQAWQEWIDWEREFQTANLAEVRKHPITPVEPLATRALGSVSRVFENPATGEIYLGVRYPGSVSHLAAISLSDGTSRRLVEVEGPMQFRVTSLAYDRAGGRLFYANDNDGLRDLMEYDLQTGKVRELFKNARTGDLVYNEASGSLWGLRTSRGRISLMRFNETLDNAKRIYTFPAGLSVYDLDISPDGQRMSASFARSNGDQSVRVFDIAALEAGETRPLYYFEMGTAVPESFVFSADGRYLLGSSYFTGISNIYRYSLEEKRLEAMSNAETGFFRPTELSDGSLMVLTYTGEGFMPSRIEAAPLSDLSATRFLGAEIARQHPVVRGWTAEQKSPATGEASTGQEEEPSGAPDLERGLHQPLASMELDSVYPVLQGYKDSVGAGLVARFSDPLFISRMDLTASYTPDSQLAADERLHAKARWDYHRLWAEATWNRADFYDLFGPTKIGRKGYGLSVGYQNPLIYDLPRRLDLKADVSVYGDLDTLPDYQNVQDSLDRLWVGRASLVYKNLRRSQGAVDDEAGTAWGLYSRVYEAQGEAYVGLDAQLDLGFPLPIGHSSLWWRNAVGASTGDRQDSLSQQYFGGFGNNYVDRLDEKQYRDINSLPGFEIDAVNGRSYAKTMLEWNLPPLRFKQLGSPGLYARYLRPALFTTALFTDPDNSALRRTFYNVGLQMDFEITFLERRALTLSVGYAVGFEEGGEDSDEFMISLKIL
ncbi:MAG: TolB family protein, partial [Steroidobacteraceae bacterium]